MAQTNATPPPVPGRKEGRRRAWTIILVGCLGFIVLCLVCVICSSVLFGVNLVSTSPAATKTPTLRATVRPSTTPTVTCADGYESPIRDDSRNGAKAIMLDSPQEHSFDKNDSTDYVKITLSAGEYTVLTDELGSGVDTTVAIEDDKGKKLADNNDDQLDLSRAKASRAVFRVEATQTIYVRITNVFGKGGCGDEYKYKIKITRSTSATPQPARTNTPQPAGSRTPNPNAQISWNDTTRTATVNDGVSAETWQTVVLQAFAIKNGVLTSDEKLDEVGLPNNKVALKITRTSGTTPAAQNNWLRVGTLPEHDGQLCRVTGDNGNPQCWWVGLSGKTWTKVK